MRAFWAWWRSGWWYKTYLSHQYLDCFSVCFAKYSFVLMKIWYLRCWWFLLFRRGAASKLPACQSGSWSGTFYVPGRLAWHKLRVCVWKRTACMQGSEIKNKSSKKPFEHVQWWQKWEDGVEKYLHEHKKWDDLWWKWPTSEMCDASGQLDFHPWKT